MVTELRIYFEGDKALRSGFRAFLAEILDQAGEKRIPFDLIATGGQPARFLEKAGRAHPTALNVLILDSEGPYAPGVPQQRGLKNVNLDQVFWMVQIMESWFLADTANVAAACPRFKIDALDTKPNVEIIPKADVKRSLKEAAKSVGGYDKTTHAPKILERINPAKVRNAAPQCDRLFRELLAHLDDAPPKA